MRKSILIAIIFAISVVKIAAQGNVRFSVFANPSINWFVSNDNNVVYNDKSFGYDIGLTLDKFFAEKYAFSTGVSIGTQGGSMQYKSNPTFSTNNGDVIFTPGTNVSYDLQYINVPVGLRLKSVEIGYFTIYANLGFTNSFNIKATGSSSDLMKRLDNSNVSKTINFYNLGYYIGAGTEYSLGGTTALIIGVNYNVGFLDITNNGSINSKNIALRLGILF